MRTKFLASIVLSIFYSYTAFAEYEPSEAKSISFLKNDETAGVKTEILITKNANRADYTCTLKTTHYDTSSDQTTTVSKPLIKKGLCSIEADNIRCLEDTRADGPPYELDIKKDSSEGTYDAILTILVRYRTGVFSKIEKQIATGLKRHIMLHIRPR